MKQRFLLTLLAFFGMFVGAWAQSPYGLTICGEPVTDDNKGNLISVITTAGGTATGTMSYDSDTKTLTLNGVEIETGDYKTIETSQPLTIQLIGTNKMTATTDVIYAYRADLTITGEGNLTVKSVNRAGIRTLYDVEPIHTLTFKETTIDIQGFGLYTEGNIASKLVIDKSTVKAPYIVNWGEIQLKDVSIKSPLGAAIDNSGWPRIGLNGNDAPNIVIEPDLRDEAGVEWSKTSLDANLYSYLTDSYLPILNNPNGLAVTYTSSDTSVATVDETGKVTIVGNGTLDESNRMSTTITAIFAGNESYKPYSTSYVMQIQKTTFDKNKHMFDKDWEKNEKYYATLGYEFVEPKPQNPFGQTITYSSSNESVATVDASTGKVTIVGVGDSFIKASFAAKNVITEGDVSYFLVVGTNATVSFPKQSYTANLGTTFEVPTVITTPSSIAIKYASSDESVASVDASTGAVTIKKVGTTVITAEFEDKEHYGDATASYTLKVEGKLVSISFPKGQYSARYGEIFTEPELQGAPDDATVEYSSGNPEYASVDAKTGKVTILSPGTVNIYANLIADEKYAAAHAEYNLNISQGSAVLSFSEQSVTTTYGEAFTAPTLTNPDKLTVSYTSSNTNVATVDEKEGTVTILIAGITTITAKFDGDTKHNAASVSYTLTVNKAKGSLSFSAETATVTYGEAFTAPTLVNEKKFFVLYESSDPNVATVNSETGAVTLHAAGETTITAKFDGDEHYEATSASYTLTVKAAIVSKDEQVEVDGQILYKPTKEVAEAIKNTFTNEIALSSEANERLTIGDDGSLTFAEGADMSLAIVGVQKGQTLTFTFNGKMTADGDALELQTAESRRAAGTINVVSGAAYTALADGNILLTLKTTEGSVKLSQINVANASGISFINADGTPAKRYNLKGQRVDESYKGIVIINGKKVVVK